MIRLYTQHELTNMTDEVLRRRYADLKNKLFAYTYGKTDNMSKSMKQEFDDLSSLRDQVGREITARREMKQ